MFYGSLIVLSSAFASSTKHKIQTSIHQHRVSICLPCGHPGLHGALARRPNSAGLGSGCKKTGPWKGPNPIVKQSYFTPYSSLTGICSQIHLGEIFIKLMATSKHHFYFFKPRSCSCRLFKFVSRCIAT